jgi:hypothetical protein
MVAQNPAGLPAYSGPATINSDGSLLVDTEDGTFAYVSGFTTAMLAGGPSLLSQANQNPYANYLTSGGVAAMNAMLVELRVLNALLIWQMGANAPDLNQMRADELYNSTIGTGVV